MTRRTSSSRASTKRQRGQRSIKDGGPRYLLVARDLTRAIASGRYPVGSQLPTELELCRDLGISRFTAREAIRVLSTAGLVTRRQRAGTTVVATPDEARYSHDANSLRDLLQYAIDTELRLVYIGRITLSRSQAKVLGAKPGDEWTYATGLRREGEHGRPICITRLYINPALKGIESKLRERKTAVYALIEKEYDISIVRVEQEIQGVVLDVDDAGNLGARAGDPALRIVRRYFDGSGRLVEVADNIHPSDRFSYRMQLRK